MPGTGKHGYTGNSLYGGNYNISNGIIHSGSGGSSSGASGNGLSAIASKAANAVLSGVNGANNYVSNNARNLASTTAGVAGFDSSDYGDYVRQALEIASNNTAQSQAFAREQMEYQRQSDIAAMAWSASEAQKNRDYQERLANTAHQREVEDLVKAGLNPILSANQGAYTGSGATGQAFSSSGAMGNVDTSASGILGQLVSTYMNTASQAAIAGMYTDATRYQADMQYAQSKMNVDANLLMHDKSLNSNERMNKLNSDTALANANTAAGASLGSAATMAGATETAAMYNFLSSIYGSDTHLEGTKYTADTNRQNIKDQINFQKANSPYYTTKTGVRNIGERLDNLVDKAKLIFGKSKSYASGRHF